MQIEQTSKKTVRYPTGKLTLLQTMAIIAVLGIAVNMLLNIYFA
jgi:hypothetical protein